MGLVIENGQKHHSETLLLLTLLLMLLCAIGILFWSTYFKTLPIFRYTQMLNLQYINLPKLKSINKINLSLNQIMKQFTITEALKQQSKPAKHSRNKKTHPYIYFILGSSPMVILS